MTETTDLLALAKKATPGPWREGTANVWKDTQVICDLGNGTRYVYEQGRRIPVSGNDEKWHADAAYIAAANPAAIIALIERHRAEVEQLTGEVIGWRAEEFAARDRAETAEAEVERLTRERDGLARQVYVPGLWECAKCGCNLVVTEMHADTGAMRASWEPQRCPNDCGPMWRKTERKAGNELVDRLEAEITKREAAESALAAERKRVGELAEILEWLDRRGGLGFDAHDRIRAALAGKDAPTPPPAA